MTTGITGTRHNGLEKVEISPNLGVLELFCQGIFGPLDKVVEVSFVMNNKGLHFLPFFLPLIAVDSHVFQLLKARFDAVLSAVPLAAHFLHYSQGQMIVSMLINRSISPMTLYKVRKNILLCTYISQK